MRTTTARPQMKRRNTSYEAAENFCLWKIEKIWDYLFFSCVHVLKEGCYWLEKHCKMMLGVKKWRSTSSTKDQSVTVGVSIDGCGAGDKTTGVVRLAGLGLKQVLGFLKRSQPHDQSKPGNNHNAALSAAVFISHIPIFLF